MKVTFLGLALIIGFAGVLMPLLVEAPTETLQQRSAEPAPAPCTP